MEIKLWKKSYKHMNLQN